MRSALECKEEKVNAYIKHFAFNDQENHRGDREGQYGAATWLNGQSAREIYLKPFEMCMKLDDITLNYVEKQADGSYQNAETTIPAAMGVMTAFNRIGATWTVSSVRTPFCVWCWAAAPHWLSPPPFPVLWAWVWP